MRAKVMGRLDLRSILQSSLGLWWRSDASLGRYTAMGVSQTGDSLSALSTTDSTKATPLRPS